MCCFLKQNHVLSSGTFLFRPQGSPRGFPWGGVQDWAVRCDLSRQNASNRSTSGARPAPRPGATSSAATSLRVAPFPGPSSLPGAHAVRAECGGHGVEHGLAEFVRSGLRSGVRWSARFPLGSARSGSSRCPTLPIANGVDGGRGEATSKQDMNCLVFVIPNAAAVPSVSTDVIPHSEGRGRGAA